MKPSVIGFLFIGCILCILKCTGEDIGRRLDPDYDRYLRNRTFEQKNEDEELSRKVKAENDARKNNSAAEFNLIQNLDTISR